MKIIIIGAGIGGLALAVACQQAGMTVKIYEQAPQLANIGGGILIWPHGQRYLHALGLKQVLQQFNTQASHCKIVATADDILLLENYRHLNQLLSGHILPVERHAFQQALLACLQPHTLELNKRCLHVQTHLNKTSVTFADGTTVLGDLIVGADGINSVVRKYIQPNSKPIYTNNCWWGGIIASDAVPDIDPSENYIALSRGKMCNVWPCAENKFMWYLPVKMPANQLNLHNPMQQLQTLCRGWNPQVDKIISAPAQSRGFHLPIFQLAPQNHWVKNRIVILGDAAHALGPILGQGTSLALEDAFMLLTYLCHEDDIDSALQQYDSLRHARFEKLYALENEASSMMLNDEPDAMDIFTSIIPKVKLADMYMELLPLVNKDVSQMAMISA